MKIKSVDFFNKIIFALKNKSQTISQIANSQNMNWDSTKNYLEQLEEIGFVYSEEIKGKCYYHLNPNPQPKKEYGTYFNLPIDEKTKQTLETYYFLIETEYKKQTQKNPTITQIYKILAKINKDWNLGLPLGWYNYGLIPPLIYNPEQSYQEQEFVSTNIKQTIPIIIEKYTKFKTIRLLLKNQYEEFDKTSYILKEAILDNFYKGEEFTKVKNNFKELIKSLLNDNISKNTLTHFNRYYTLLLDIEKNMYKDYEIKQQLIEQFKEIFKLAAIEYYRKSLIEKNFISEYIINSITQKEMQSQNTLVKEQCRDLIDTIENTYNIKITRPILDFQRGSEHDLQNEEEQEELLKKMNLL